MNEILVNAINKINDLKDSEIVKSGNFEYIKDGYTKVNIPKCQTMTVNGLDSLVDYLESNIDEIDFSQIMIHVVDEKNVNIVSKLEDITGERKNFISARCIGEDYGFGYPFSQETFIINLHASFIPGHDLDYVLKTASAVSLNNEAKTVDNGLSQSVQVKSGIATVENLTIKPVVLLQPIRTFREIDDQPISRFVFRIKQDHGDVNFRLIEADGGAWRIQAIKSVKEWIANTLKEKNISVPII